MPDLNTITPPQLMRLIGTPDLPVIIDVRIPDDIAAAPRLVPTSVLCSHKDVADLPDRLDGRPSVVLCHGGLKLSHGTAAYLRDTGLKSEVLAGGMLAWADAGLPTVPLDAIPPGNLWVTRQRPKIDRIACPWLIRRFVDPTARFLFVPSDEVLNIADRFDATPFDVADVQFTHRGKGCTFDAMITDFGLAHDALERLADVVRAADTDRHADSPQAAGLLALSVGLSRSYKDDNAQLDAAMPLYDALYRWARDGFTEGHETPLGTSS